MKTSKKTIVLSLSALIATSIAMAQPYPAYKVLDDLTATQTTRLKQLGKIQNNNTVNPIYDAKVERILTPEQNARYTKLKYGARTPSSTKDFNFNLDRK